MKKSDSVVSEGGSKYNLSAEVKLNFQNSFVSKHDDGDSADKKQEVNREEGEVLLYHYLTIVAMKEEGVIDFLEIREKYLRDDADNALKANIQMLYLYQLIKTEKYDTAANEILILQNQFQ